jgi:outer membrane immunogenic protein
MRFHKLHALALLTVLLLAPAALLSQNVPAQNATVFGIDKGQVPAMEIGLGYAFLHANAPPPGTCGCFSLNGGSLTWVINMPRGFSLVSDFTGAHANNVNGTDQNIGLFNFVFGPRYTLRKHRYQPYVEALVGGSNEFSNYAYVSNVTALAAQGGIGLSTTLNRYIAFNIFEADYLYSQLPNGAGNSGYQNDLRVRTGIIFRFGPR